ncbi:3'(2'),5'-bisphosphate nucleotidase CysQ [Actinomadura alba]|uniref:inositol-phosphate phosphatase n=1 Tax=Actinomadura alba TaxID=406431 RepID=A0ABR7LQS7_9ACTN|nr:3'(2'),5'-bisphosphate nucleotidase CysQ [Actinomadura alba]MBC6467197.1 3'(2'),5'-bisphosphate nucleotidase CysQ [Actinomadura alba]
MTKLSEDGPVAADDHALAAELARSAGRLLLDLRDDMGFADPRALKDAGDRASHEYLMSALARYRPKDAVLSEEGPEGRSDPTRPGAERVWIIDPLDGTREFGEEGRDDWAVHVALWTKNFLVAGAVALPGLGRTLATVSGGAEVVDESTSARSPLVIRDLPDVGHIRVTVSRSRPPRFMSGLQDYLEARGVTAEIVPIGSAGAKISAVLVGEVDAYVHAGGQYEWDSAAPVAVALAAGAHASRVNGAELVYNRQDPTLPDILVCHPELAPMLLAGIREVEGGGQATAPGNV